MAEPELFPRGKKTPTKASPGSSKGKAKPRSGTTEETKGSKTSSQGQGGRKRKAVGSQPSPAGGEGDKDWLFGAPQAKKSPAASGKKAREGNDARSSTTGKVCMQNNLLDIYAVSYLLCCRHGIKKVACAVRVRP